MMREIILAFCLCLASAAGSAAQDIKGAPDELIGAWGKDRQQCRSYNRKYDDVTFISRERMQFCGGFACEAQIVSHKITNDGYVLRLRSKNNQKGWSTRYIRIDEGVFENVSEPRKNKEKSEVEVKCGLKDIISGIGLKDGASGETKALDVAFAAYYAAQVPTVCPQFKSNDKLIALGLDMATKVWRDFLASGPNAQPKDDAAATIRSQKVAADYAVREDSAALKDFCDHILSRFGSDGSVVKDLIVDPRQKT